VVALTKIVRSMKAPPPPRFTRRQPREIFPYNFSFARPLKKNQKGKGKFLLGSALNSSGGAATPHPLALQTKLW